MAYSVQEPLLETTVTKDFPKWEDDVVYSYWLMGSPHLIATIIIGYLVFVTRLGPYLMASRKPFSLKYTMMGYNIFQVFYNLWFLFLFLEETRWFPYMMEESCYPHSPTRSKTMRLFAFKVTWICLISKVSDLIDTVFFVMRKKHSHISFLHVYHHTQMVLIVWLYFMYVRGEQGIMIGIVNSVVHVIMYSYYFLSALGPRVQMYLWWKKYITWLQLFQFFILTVYFLTLLCLCRSPPLQTVYNMYAVLQGFVFTALFLNFYFKSYTKPVKKCSIIQETKLL